MAGLNKDFTPSRELEQFEIPIGTIELKNLSLHLWAFWEIRTTVHVKNTVVLQIIISCSSSNQFHHIDTKKAPLSLSLSLLILFSYFVISFPIFFSDAFFVVPLLQIKIIFYLFNFGRIFFQKEIIHFRSRRFSPFPEIAHDAETLL